MRKASAAATPACAPRIPDCARMSGSKGENSLSPARESWLRWHANIRSLTGNHALTST